MSPAPLPDFNGVILEEAQLVIGECIGSGAFGRVHQATFVGHHYYSPYPRDARLAVKCLPRPSAPTPGPQRDSLQARELSSHLKVSSHPSIATIHQVLFDKTYFYVVMDRYDGDLFEAIVDKGVFKDNDELIKNVFLQILEAVEFCHSNGVYHRDLKPRNVLYEQVGEQMNVRLTDFGLATLNEVSNTIKCGTSRYMSPESFGTEYRREAGYSTVQSDIWSLGVVLFNMITGHNPWNSPSLKDGHFSSYVADNNHLFRKHNISPEVNNIIQRIFVVEPNSRISISKLKNEIKSVKTFFREMQDTVNTVPFPVNDSAGPQIPSPTNASFGPLHPALFHTFPYPKTPTVPAPAFLPTTHARAPSAISSASYSYPDAETASNRPIWISELTEPYSAPTASDVSVISQPFGGPSSSDDDPSVPPHPSSSSSQSENESISSTGRSPTSSSSSEETSSSSRSSNSNSTPSSSSSPSTVLGIKSIEGPYSSTLTPFSSPVFDNDENNDNNNDIVTYDCRSRPRLSLNPRLIRRFRPNSVPIPSSSSSPSPSSPSPSPSSPSFPTSNRHRFSTPTTFCSHYRKTDHDHMTTTTIENGKETQGQGERCTATKGSRMSRMGRKFWNETKRVLSGMS